MNELEKLKKENIILKKKLNSAQKWMHREVQNAKKNIKRDKIFWITNKIKNIFINENLEEIITEKIRQYFWDYILMNVNADFTENLISGEIAYYHFKKNPNIDGFSVVSSYHKAIDSVIEQFITKWFRKFAKKNKNLFRRKNDLIEKYLDSVVRLGYIISFWKLYFILDKINKNEELYDYWKTFKKFLDKYFYLKEKLLDEEFLRIYKEIADSWILWKKRHSGQISFIETRKLRKLILWDLNNKKSFLYILLSSQDVEF